MSKRRFTTTIDGTEYTVNSDNSVLWNDGFGSRGYWRRANDQEAISEVLKRKSKRDKRNATARARHAAMTDLGMRRVRGALGGTYYE